jgi:hypothetical protein
MIVAMAVSVTVALLTASCSNDEFFGFDDMKDYTFTLESSIYSNDFQKYLDLDIDTIKKWSRKDLTILDEAEYRMGIRFDEKNRFYTRNYNTYLELNISEKLYNRIWDNYYHNNLILGETTSKKRVKKRNSEGAGIRYDCVPISLSYCLATPYSTVVRVCNNVDPGWNNRGVDLGYVGIIVDSLGYSMNTYYSPQEVRNHYGSSDIDINAMLITSNTGGNPKYHAVCAYHYDGSSWWINKIFYNDYQGGYYNCWMAVSGVEYLFEF